MGMSIAKRLADVSGALTASEERAAKVLEKDPSKVAFGSLAEVAAETGTSGPTVVRLATKLGFSGFSEMKEAIQEELSVRLAPASVRIGADDRTDVAGRVAATDAENVLRSLEASGPSIGRVVAMLADERHAVFVLPATGCRAIGVALVDLLSQLRDGVRLAYGPATDVARELAGVRRGDVVVVIDTRRYDRWVVDGANQARSAGAKVVAITDTPLSPLVAGSNAHLLVRVVGAGPFDSLTGAMSVVNALAAGVAAKAHLAAGDRLRKAEEALMEAGALVDVTQDAE
jgi:DNA-binding MurR/RpiR family transcriptional regulator